MVRFAQVVSSLDTTRKFNSTSTSLFGYRENQVFPGNKSLFSELPKVNFPSFLLKFKNLRNLFSFQEKKNLTLSSLSVFCRSKWWGGFEEFEPIFDEPRIEWSKNSNPSSGLMGQFLMRIFAPDYNHLKIQVTDYHSNTFEDAKSVMQLDDLVSVFFFFNYYYYNHGFLILWNLGFKVCNFFFFLMGAMQRDCIGIGGSWTELVE
jgi:hypothetical protein